MYFQLLTYSLLLQFHSPIVTHVCDRCRYLTEKLLLHAACTGLGRMQQSHLCSSVMKYNQVADIEPFSNTATDQHAQLKARRQWGAYNYEERGMCSHSCEGIIYLEGKNCLEDRPRGELGVRLTVSHLIYRDSTQK
jgi:hypothetical protein